MIHRLSADNGADLGTYDHGVEGRTSFTDGWTGSALSLPPVSFDPTTSARIDGCAAGPFERHPECWNYADFRRRIWGLAVRHDDDRNEIRLYYAVWGSDAFGNPEWDSAGDDRRNAIWSVRIASGGAFDTTSVRREFFLPSFFTTDPANGVLAGNSRPPSDVEFADCGPQRVMLVAERGSVRNLGLGKEDPFAYPHESRVLRYELGSDGIWRPAGRYDVGFYERQKHGVPRLRASGAGGCDFGYGYSADNTVDLARPNEFVWMTGDNLCSPNGPCYNPGSGYFDDTSWVDGMQGTPENLTKEVMPAAALSPPPSGPATPDDGPASSYMVDSDINVDANGSLILDGIDRNEATLIGDIDIFERCAGVDYGYQPPDITLPPLPPPVHSRDMTHMRNASPMHLLSRSWHERNWSWHSRDRSWHYRNRSWHSRDRSWHWRNSSWHWLDRSWHARDRSWHWKDRSWHWKNNSWHSRERSWHSKDRSWHWKSTSWHFLNRSWHNKENSWHDRLRSWHWKSRSWHEKIRSWHDRDRSWHDKSRSWHDRRRSEDERHDRFKSDQQLHNRIKSDLEHHSKQRSDSQLHNKIKSDLQHHSKQRSDSQLHNRIKSDLEHHSKQRSDSQLHNKIKSDLEHHSKQRSDSQLHNRIKSDLEHHSKQRSDSQLHNRLKSDAEHHSRDRSEAQQHNRLKSNAEQHSRDRSEAQQHNRLKSDAERHDRDRSEAQRHSREKSNAVQQGGSGGLKKRHDRHKSLEEQEGTGQSAPIQ
jgi:hypothetical protein